MIITNEHLSGVTFDVCQTMLGMNIAEQELDTSLPTPELAASIQISGDHNAVIEVSTCQLAGRNLSIAMFGIAPEDSDIEEIADAISEIVNIIGGNIKGMLEGECQLSIPCFNNHDLSDFHEDSKHISFDVDGGVMNISFRSLETSVQASD